MIPSVRAKVAREKASQFPRDRSDNELEPESRALFNGLLIILGIIAIIEVRRSRARARARTCVPMM